MKITKKYLIITAVLLSITVTSVIVVANETDGALPWMQQADQDIADSIELKKAELGASEKLSAVPEEGYSLYMSKASSKTQVEALNKLEADRSLGYGVWTRDSLLILGELPKSTGRITLKDAQKVSRAQKDEASIVASLNSIAGAPDWQGGSGIHRTVYFLDEEHKESIVIIDSHMYHVSMGTNGEEVVLDLEGNVSEAKPSASPDTK